MQMLFFRTMAIAGLLVGICTPMMADSPIRGGSTLATERPIAVVVDKSETDAFVVSIEEVLETGISHYIGKRGIVDNPAAHDLILSAAATGDPVSMFWVARSMKGGRAGFDLDSDGADAMAR